MKPRVRKLPVGWWVSGEGWCPTSAVLDHCLSKPERRGWSGAMSAVRGMRADWLTFRACRLLVKAYKLDRGHAREAAVRAVASRVLRRQFHEPYAWVDWLSYATALWFVAGFIVGVSYLSGVFG